MMPNTSPDLAHFQPAAKSSVRAIAPPDHAPLKLLCHELQPQLLHPAPHFDPSAWSENGLAWRTAWFSKPPSTSRLAWADAIYQYQLAVAALSRAVSQDIARIPTKRLSHRPAASPVR